MPVDNFEEKAITVTELTNSIKAVLEQNLPKYYIKGEISNFLSHSSGHIYFTLKDENNQVKVAFFRGGTRTIASELEDGKEVIIYGRVSIYGKRSEYQVIAEDISIMGAGSLLLEFEKLKKKLAGLGLFDNGLKRPIPRFPSVIGIVTSPTGAVIQDMINVISRRYNPVVLKVYPSLVQGSEASGQIIEGIKFFNSAKDEAPDVIVLARGGGSIEDLWPFNDESLAYVIRESRIPVVSAVGHEVDYTIADFAADLRAPTPSAAAELIVPDTAELISFLESSATRLSSGLTNKVKHYEQKLARAAKSYGFKKPFELFERYVRQIDESSLSMDRALDRAFKRAHEDIKNYGEKLGMLNPLAILKKGYSVVYDSAGNIAKDAEKFSGGDEIIVKMYKGSLEAEVKKYYK